MEPASAPSWKVMMYNYVTLRDIKKKYFKLLPVGNLCVVWHHATSHSSGVNDLVLVSKLKETIISCVLHKVQQVCCCEDGRRCNAAPAMHLPLKTVPPESLLPRWSQPGVAHLEEDRWGGAAHLIVYTEQVKSLAAQYSRMTDTNSSVFSRFKGNINVNTCDWFEWLVETILRNGSIKSHKSFKWPI